MFCYNIIDFFKKQQFKFKIKFMEIILFIIILLFSIILHEIAHGYAALRNGDDLALRQGRLTLNPISHIDPIGSIIIPIIGYFAFNIPFGWAKPVPYRPEIIRQKKYGELEVSSAGVIINFFLAIIAIISFYILSHFGFMNEDIYKALFLIAITNIILGTFNLLPFPPADGWHIFGEIIKHIKNIFNKILAKISGKHYYETKYIHEKNFTDKMSFFFSNPIMMFIIIFFVIQIFSLMVPHIFNFVEYLFNLQIK